MAGLAWTDLTPAHLETLAATPDPAQKIQLLCEAVAVKHYADNTWSGILVDFLYYSLLFCEERGMAPEKTSAFFSIMKRVFEYTFRPDLEPGNVHPAEPRIAMEDSFAFFKDQMLAHSVEDVETAAVGLFSVQDVECVAEFISTTFYRHFKAYRSRVLIPRRASGRSSIGRCC